MNPSSVLLTLAEFAIAIVGFSGVVTAFRPSEDSRARLEVSVFRNAVRHNKIVTWLRKGLQGGCHTMGTINGQFLYLLRLKKLLH